MKMRVKENEFKQNNVSVNIWIAYEWHFLRLRYVSLSIFRNKRFDAIDVGG